MAQDQDSVNRPNGGSVRTHQIEADIDRTRAAMDRTVDAIAGKLTPQQLMVEAMGVFKDGSSALATKLVQTAREHPVPATIIGIGIGLLLTERAKSSSSALRPFEGDRSVDHVKEQAAHVKDQVKTQAGHLKEQVLAGTEHVREGADHLREQVAQGAGRLREQAAQVPVYARQQWHDAQLGFWQTMDQKPFAVGIAALAAGVAAGLTVPSSRKEKELMGETRDRLLDQAKDLGREAVDKGKQVARVAADVVKTEVEKQGLKPAAIADKVRTITREAEQALKSEAGRVIAEPLEATGTPVARPESSSPGGAAGRGMSAGFAEASRPPSGAWDPDSTVSTAGKPRK